MRIHIQNPLNDSLFGFTMAMWEAAVARAPAAGAGHVVTIGTTEADFATAMADAEAPITDKSTVKRHFPTAAPQLKLLFVTSAGLEGLPPMPPGVSLLNNRGTHAVKAGEFALMAVLMLASRIPAFVTAQRAGRWAPQYGSVLRGQRVTIVGLGGLGGSAAAQLHRFGMRITGVRTVAEPHPHCETVITTAALEEVLPRTDILVLACPLTDATRNLLSRARLAMLPAGAGLVNIGRGGLVDQDAVCDALDDGHLSGAVLDVFSPEPIPAGHRLWSSPNVVITPHISVDDPQTYNPVSLDIFLSNLLAYDAGRPLPTLFDQVRGY